MGLANAQLCAAIRINDYYEQLVINEEQIDDLDDLGKLAIVDGDPQRLERAGPGPRDRLGACRARRGRRAPRPMDAAAEPIGKPASTARRRLGQCSWPISPTAASGPIYLLVPSLVLILRGRALPDALGHRLELPRDAAQPPRPRHGLRRTEALRGDDRRPGLLAVAAEHDGLDHRRGRSASCCLGLAAALAAQSRPARLPAASRAHAAALVPAQRGRRPYVGADARSAARRDQRHAGEGRRP